MFFARPTLAESRRASNRLYPPEPPARSLSSTAALSYRDRLGDEPATPERADQLTQASGRGHEAQRIGVEIVAASVDERWPIDSERASAIRHRGVADADGLGGTRLSLGESDSRGLSALPPTAPR